METKPSLSPDTIVELINRIQDKAKEIPHDQTAALQVIEMCLSVINAYAEWVNLLKNELLGLVNINTEQQKVLNNYTEMAKASELEQ